jgi:hypothetical protein
MLLRRARWRATAIARRTSTTSSSSSSTPPSAAGTATVAVLRLQFVPSQPGSHDVHVPLPWAPSLQTPCKHVHAKAHDGPKNPGAHAQTPEPLLPSLHEPCTHVQADAQSRP